MAEQTAEQTMDVETFMALLNEGIPSTLIPYFMMTSQNQFTQEVIRRVRQELTRGGKHSFFLLFEESLSLRKVRRIWDGLVQHGNKVLGTPESDDIQIHIVRGIPTEFLMKLIGAIQNIEVVEEGTR